MVAEHIITYPRDRKPLGVNSMKASEFDVGNYLNSTTASLLVGRDIVVYEVRAEDVRDKKKMIMGFEGVDKALIVNKTNRMIMVEAFGDETDDWVGRTVRIEITKRMYQGKPLPGILVVPNKDIPVHNKSDDVNYSRSPGKKKSRENIS